MIRPINDQVEIEQLKRLKDGLVEAQAHLRADWLVNKGWVGVPVESAGHFDQADVRLLSRVFEDVNIERLVAIATEPLNESPNCLLLETSEAGLMEFSSECSHFNFLLTPPIGPPPCCAQFSTTIW
jgi:hypothetical protein